MNKIHGVYRLQSKQWLAALAATLTMINVGNELFWVTKTLKSVTGGDESIRNYKYFIWNGFFVAGISCVAGAILGAILAEKFGRRKILLVTSFFTICQIVSSFTTNCTLSYVTLILGEIGLGITRVVVPLYISEIVEDDIRGALLMLQVPFFCVGRFIGIGIGNLVSDEIVGVVLSILTGIFLVAFSRFPETPYYLASKKRDEAAAKSLAFYRGIEDIATQEGIDKIMGHDSRGHCRKLRELVRPTNCKGLAIVIFFIIVNWSQIVIDTRCDFLHVLMGTQELRVYEAEVIVYVTSLIISFLIVFTIDAFGRRSFLLCSSFLSFILVILTLVFIMKGNRVFEWVFGIAWHFCHLVVFSVPFVYVGEFFSSNVKALAIAALTTFDILTRFVVISLPEALLDDVRSFDVTRSLVGSIIILVAFPVTFAFIPETKRKSFSDIQSTLAKTLHCRWLSKKLNRTEHSK